MANESTPLQGVPEMLRALKNIDENIANKWARTALRNAAKIVANACRADAPVKSGKTKEAIKVRAGKRSRVRVSMNVVLSSKLFPKGGFYLGFVDRGHKTRKSFAKNWTIKRLIPGTFWAEKAFLKSVYVAFEEIKRTLAEGLASEAARSGAKKV